jgi:PAS domain S-box-containing protein
MNHHTGNSNYCVPTRKGQENSFCKNPPKHEKAPLSETLRLLLVDNSSHDGISMVNELRRAGFEVSHKRVETAEGFRAQLNENTWDVIICDYCLGNSDGMAILELHQKMGCDIPFIMVSASIGEELAVEILKAGAHEYVMKQNLSRLVPAVIRELRAAQERQIRRRADSTHAYLASVVDCCNDAIIGETLDGTIVSWNRGAERLFGYAASEMIGRSASILAPIYRPEELDEVQGNLRSNWQVGNLVTVRVRKDGSEVEVSLSISPIKDFTGRIIGTSTVARDVTFWKEEENERLELIRDLTSALAIKIHHVEPLSSVNTAG